MARPTKAETEATILDGAAALFARHGFARTSLKLIASALDYTNAGLLHHFASKQALYDAVMDLYVEQIRASFARVEGTPPGLALDRAFVEDALDFALDWPGLSAFGTRLLIEENAEDPRFQTLGLRLLALVGVDIGTPDFERLMRIHGAMTGISHNVRLARKMGRLAEMRGRIVATAMDTLGHYGER